MKGGVAVLGDAVDVEEERFFLGVFFVSFAEKRANSLRVSVERRLHVIHQFD